MKMMIMAFAAMAVLLLENPARALSLQEESPPATEGEEGGALEAVPPDEEGAETAEPAQTPKAGVGSEQEAGKEAGKEESKEKEAGKSKDEKKAGMGGPEPQAKVFFPNVAFRFNRPDSIFQFKGSVEMGFIGVLKHTIQFSKSGTEFDYRKEGGQDVLFFFARLSAEFEFARHHSLIFLYQPLNIETEAVLGRDVAIDELTFPEGTPINLRYGFDFYRFSYLYDFFKDPDLEVAIGLSLQIRNARISFTSADGQLRRARDDIGPVPVIKLRLRYTFKPGVWLGFEGDGFWASGKIITGSTNDFEGAILDASLRVGFNLTSFLETFVNVRYIGGGARGTDKDSRGPGDGYTNNWIHTMSLTLGFGFK